MDSQTQKVWSLSAMDMMDDDVDLIDTDDLLDENDLKRPNPESLRGVLLSMKQLLLFRVVICT